MILPPSQGIILLLRICSAGAEAAVEKPMFNYLLMCNSQKKENGG